jgi:hypothetical protein
MRKATFLLAAACTFALIPFERWLGPVSGAIMMLAVSVALATAASGGLLALGVASGAIGAFAGGALGGISPAVAGACLVGAAFAERTTRVRGRTARAVHVGVAVLGGALAGSLAAGYASASLAVRAVSLVVAAVLAGLPLLIDADDPLAHALDQTALALPEPIRTSLRDGAELRRNADEVPLDRVTARGVRRTWRSLLQLAEARLRLERAGARRVGLRVAASDPQVGSAAPPSAADAVRKMVDQRITDSVAALTRAYSAVDTARAAELGLDDAAARSVDAAGESLEDVSRAIIEVKGQNI